MDKLVKGEISLLVRLFRKNDQQQRQLHYSQRPQQKEEMTKVNQTNLQINHSVH